MAQSISQEAIGATGLPGATAASRYAGATASGAPTSGTFAVGDFIVDQSGSTWICTASSQTASATTASGNGNLITFTASNSFSPGQYVNVTGFSNTGYNVSNAYINSASSTQFTVVSSATGSTTGTGTAVTTGTWTRQLPSTTQVAGKNGFINGDFGVWQRGTSFTVGSGASTYTADRWLYQSDSSLTTTITQQTFTPGTAPVSGYEGTYFIRLATTGTAASYPSFNQRIEDVRKYAGQTITVSFWAKASSSCNANSAINQNFGSGGSSQVQTGYPSYYIGTSWQRISFQYNVPSIAGKTIGTSSYLEIQMLYFNAGTVMPGTVDVWGAQIEAGPTATQFTTASGSIGGELALCQRYYIRTTPGLSYGTYGFGFAQASTTAVVAVNLPVTMRTVPTTLDYSNLALQSGSYSSSVNASGALAFEASTSSPQLVMIFANYTTGMTANQPARLLNNNNTAGYLGVGAEL